MSNLPAPTVSLASVICTYLLTAFPTPTNATHIVGHGMPEDTVTVDGQDLILSFTCVSAPMFRHKMEKLALSQSLDVVLVRCYAHSFDALPASIDACLAGGGLAPFTLTNLTIYRHHDDGLWLVPQGFGASIQLSADGLRLDLVPPYDSLIARAEGIYRSTADLAERLYPQVVR